VMSKIKTVYLIRHGQSTYNAFTHSFWNWITLRCCFDPKIYDPSLSPKGEAQAKQLRQKLIRENYLSKIQLIVTSPLIRAIQTSLYGFPQASSPSPRILNPSRLSPLQEPLLEEKGDDIKLDTFSTTITQPSPSSTYSTFSGDEKSVAEEKSKLSKVDLKITTTTPSSIPLLVNPLLHEITDTCGDIGSPPSELKKRFPALDLTSLTTDHWWYHTSTEGPRVPVSEPVEHVDERIQGFCKFLLSRPEEQIAVVGHSKFFMRWTGKWKMPNCGIKKFYLDQQGVLQEPPRAER